MLEQRLNHAATRLIDSSQNFDKPAKLIDKRSGSRDGHGCDWDRGRLRVLSQKRLTAEHCHDSSFDVVGGELAFDSSVEQDGLPGITGALPAELRNSGETAPECCGGVSPRISASSISS